MTKHGKLEFIEMDGFPEILMSRDELWRQYVLLKTRYKQLEGKYLDLQVKAAESFDPNV